jgi:hypothetical protein
VAKRWSWVAWSMLAVYLVSLVALGALSVANDSFDQEPLADTLALLLAFHGVHGGGRLDRGPPAGQCHGLALHS